MHVFGDLDHRCLICTGEKYFRNR